MNSVLPVPTRSEGVNDFITNLAHERGGSVAKVEDDFFKNVRPSSLLKRFATTDEVANMIVHLCSPAASATHGTALRVDGGVIKSAV